MLLGEGLEALALLTVADDEELDVRPLGREDREVDALPGREPADHGRAERMLLLLRVAWAPALGVDAIADDRHARGDVWLRLHDDVLHVLAHGDETVGARRRPAGEG